MLSLTILTLGRTELGRCWTLFTRKGNLLVGSLRGRIKETARLRNIYQAPERVQKRSMRVNGLDSANAGADEPEFKPPAFQIIVLVRTYRYSTSYSPHLTNVSAPFLQSPLRIIRLGGCLTTYGLVILLLCPAFVS